MKRNRTLILITILLVLCLGVIESYLYYLFPPLGLEGIFFYILLMYFLPISSGILFYVVSKSSVIPRKSLWITLLIVGSIFIQITFHPVSSLGWSLSNNVWVKMHEYVSVYMHYPDDVKYEDLAFGNEAQRIAASVKYKESLPNMIAVLNIYKRIGTNKAGGSQFDRDNIERQFYFEKTDGEISHDSDQFILEQREDGLWLIADPNSPNPTEYFFTDREFDISKQFDPFSAVSWYYGDYLFNISSHNFISETGAGELLYKYLSSR